MSVMLLFLLISCTSEAPPFTEVTPYHETLDFGEIPIDTWKMEQTGIVNTGEVDISLLSVSITDGDLAIWALEQDGEETELGREDSAVFSITFAPKNRGDHTARLQLRTDGLGYETMYINLMGNGGATLEDDDGDGFSPAEGDCDNQDPSIYPGAPELCDGEDNDCDGNIDDEEYDFDGDGWRTCEGDCDDTERDINPNAEEECDDLDTDCDGEIPDREDYDGDGYTLCDKDCDDDEPESWPDNQEICDGIDNDCSGTIDDIDEDGDGHSPCLGDCDDGDPNAWPVMVDDNGSPTGDGTLEDPVLYLASAIELVDEICRTIIIQPGTYAARQTWSSGDLSIVGVGDWPDDVIIENDEGSGDPMFQVSNGAHLTLQNLTLYGGNTTGDGGAVAAEDADLTVEDVIAIDNTCTDNGGAISVRNGNLSIQSSVFQSNTAGQDGGGVFIQDGSIRDSESTYLSNSAESGGGLWSSNTAAELSDLSIQSNTAGDAGGGLYMESTESFSGSRLTTQGNTAEGNGGGMWISNVSDPSGYINNSIVQDNSAGGSGGGLYISGASGLMIANNTIVANSAVGAGGGMSANIDSGELWIWSNIVADSSGNSCLHAADVDGISVSYNVVFSESSSVGFDIFDAEKMENQEVDPMFSTFTNDGDFSNDNLSLFALSPAIDSGPTDGEGSENYTTWTDIDMSQNDRGHSGGPFAAE